VEDINWEEEIKYDPGLRKQLILIILIRERR